ncbi:energy-coupling factor transporter transmembrane component T family protein [Halobaculum sp. D14]|uniref:energy-coupling factor transporter transmembrane component T family protein n=1 Tax=unclassified Halobaculum TaxID=2640896 RepID=UPI003EC0C429
MKLRVPTLYNDRDTLVHRRDPRAKIFVFLVLVALIYVAPTWQWMAALTVVGLGVAVLARVPPLWLGALYGLQLINILSIVFFPSLPEIVAGTFTWSLDGGALAAGLKLALAWTAALVTSVSLFSTMRVEEMADGFRGLGAPEVFCFAWQYTLLLLYLTVDDMIRIADATKLKGVKLETRNPLTLARNLPRMFIPVVFTVVRRANTMMAVLQQRGYSFTERPPATNERRFGAGDAAFAVVGAAVLVLALADRVGVVTVPMLT